MLFTAVKLFFDKILNTVVLFLCVCETFHSQELFIRLLFTNFLINKRKGNVPTEQRVFKTEGT